MRGECHLALEDITPNHGVWEGSLVKSETQGQGKGQGCFRRETGMRDLNQFIDDIELNS